MDDAFELHSNTAPIVIPEKMSRIHGLFAFLTIAFAAALIRGHAGAETDAGRLAVDLFMGGLTLGCLLLWVYMVRHPARLEISRDAITQRLRGGKTTTFIQRADGDLYMDQVWVGRHPQAYLKVTGSDQAIHLMAYDVREIAEAAIRSGWNYLDRPPPR